MDSRRVRHPAVPSGLMVEHSVRDDPGAPALDSGLGRVATVAVFIGVVAAVVAGATIWLVLTDPITVANAVEQGEISPLVLQLADVLYNALVGLLNYL
jgi:hypothetical protein